ncbi:MAG: RNA polymerase sporulation sigma factor SigK [Eubacteriales bacterium]|nr:RNA polymerase sporulation sigma factor SigK [Clostridium sp.]MDY6081253.1 RNA polymerase sporulation sigma factor SigK [Eubacteriales bacterium]
MLLELLQELFLLAGYVGGSGSFPPPLPAAEEARLVRQMRSGSEEAREKLITHNLRLVAHIAKKYVRCGRDADDVISIGTIGLIKAVSTFDAQKSTALSSYASRCIENEILMSIRLERKQVAEVSISEPIGLDSDGNNISIAEVLGTEPDMIFDAVRQRLDTERIFRTMQWALTERESTVVRLRYGLFGMQRLSQREIANLLGISRSYVSRIEKKALEKLNTALEKP